MRQRIAKNIKIDKVHVNKTSDNSDKLDVTYPNFDIQPLATCYGKKKTTKKSSKKKATKKVQKRLSVVLKKRQLKKRQLKKTSKKVTKKKS